MPRREPFSLSHRLNRALWKFIWAALASWTPPSMRDWRRFLLRIFGAEMAERADVRGGARVWYPPHLLMEQDTILANGVNCYNMDFVVIRRGSVVSQGAFLCGGTHDYSCPDRPLVTKPIVIGADSWIGAEAFIGPGVTVGTGAILGARGVTFSNLEPAVVYIGNPARALKKRPQVES